MANIPLQSIKFPDLPNTYTIPQIDTTLHVSGAIPDSKVVGDTIAEQRVIELLSAAEIPDTTQTYTFTDGAVSQVVHKDGNNVAVRTDSFTYGANTITEARVLYSGDTLTIVTNLTTLETTVTYSQI